MLQLSQRPLSSSSADADLFVGYSRELDKILRATQLNLNCLVLGTRGSGKTSLLHQVERRLRETDLTPWFLDASAVGSTQALIDQLAEMIHRRPKPSRPEAAFLRDSGMHVHSDIRRLGDGITSRQVVLLDSIPSPSIAHDLFGRHRDELWDLPFTWVVSGNTNERKRFLEPPADAFFDAVVVMEELSDDDAKELLTRRLGTPVPRADAAARALKMNIPALVEQMKEENPRQLLAAARSIVLDADDAAATTSRLARQQARASAIGHPAAVLFSELIDRGAVSASDADLLETLGWTRSRVVQVMKQLEEDGLVVSSMESSDGPGRPRKLSRINPHSDIDDKDATT